VRVHNHELDHLQEGLNILVI